MSKTNDHFLRPVNIGEAIIKRLNELNLTKANFARSLEMNPSNLNKFLKKRSVDTGVLVKISRILKYNFFGEFVPSVYTSLSSSASFAPKDQKFFIREVNIGEVIAQHLRIQGLSQKELVSRLRNMEGCEKIRQADISMIVNSDTVDTSKLYNISLVLDWNFFNEYCEHDWESAMFTMLSRMKDNHNREKTQELVDGLLNVGKEKDAEKSPNDGISELLSRIEQLAIENNSLREENASLRQKLTDAGIIL